ncbi:hypothetical protein NDU88_007759, partial [Pleurodeles waltl]
MATATPFGEECCSSPDVHSDAVLATLEKEAMLGVFCWEKETSWPTRDRPWYHEKNVESICDGSKGEKLPGPSPGELNKRSEGPDDCYPAVNPSSQEEAVVPVVMPLEGHGLRQVPGVTKAVWR